MDKLTKILFSIFLSLAIILLVVLIVKTIYCTCTEIIGDDDEQAYQTNQITKDDDDVDVVVPWWAAGTKSHTNVRSNMSVSRPAPPTMRTVTPPTTTRTIVIPRGR